jgi:cobalt/nickel transport system permease protein
MSGQLSLRDFFQIEQSQYGGKAYGWRLWDARPKIALTVLAMALNVLVANARLSGILFLLAAGLTLYSRCPWKMVLLFLLAPAWATLLLVLGMAFGLGTLPMWHVGPLTMYQDGLEMGLNAGLRVAADVAWAGLLVITTPFTDMLEGLRWFRVPTVVVDTLAYIYRYVFLLYDEFISMRSSAQARGGFARFSSTMSTSGLIAAQIFMRSYDRAGRVWQAMQARGGEGSGHGF